MGLFDGLGALRLAVDSLGVGVAGHLSVEKEGAGRRVVESIVEAFFPDTTFHDDVKTVDAEVVGSLAMRFPSVAMVLIGAGPPCQGVSGLNASKKGALRGVAFTRKYPASEISSRRPFLGLKCTF